MTLLDVAGVAQRLLDLVVDVAAAESVNLPSRRYIASGVGGAEAWDGEQITVGLQQMQPGNASRQGALAGLSTQVPPGASPMVAAVLRVEIVRCVPTVNDNGDPPSAAKINASGVAALRDAALLHAVRVKATTEATLTGGEPGDIAPGPITPSGPEGGLAGMTLVLSVTALGLEP